MIVRFAPVPYFLISFMAKDILVLFLCGLRYAATGEYIMVSPSFRKGDRIVEFADL